MLPPLHIALVTELPSVRARELARVASALSVQVARDLGPAWGISATVDAYHNLDDVPASHWPIILERDINSPGAAGVHENEKDGSPFALVALADNWSLTASHECLEMLVDPSGNRLFPATIGGKAVKILAEVSDPSEADDYAYVINGVTVSDFYKPNYFDPKTTTPCAQNSPLTPLGILPGGYVSYVDSKGHWHQATWFEGPKPVSVTLGRLTRTGNWRSTIDRIMAHRRQAPGATVALASLAPEPDLSLRAQVERIKSQ